MKTFHNENIMEVESLPNLQLAPFLAAEDDLYEQVNYWDDEVEDPSITYVERLIGSGFIFSKGIWRGGYAGWLVILPQSKVGKKAPVKEKGQKTKPINKGKGKVGEESSAEEANQQGPFADLDVEALMKRIDEKLDAHTVEIKQLYAADLKLMRDQLQDEITADGGHNMEVADRFVLLSEDDVAESEEEDDSGLNDSKIIDEDKEASTMEQARAEDTFNHDGDPSKSTDEAEAPKLDIVTNKVNKEKYHHSASESDEDVHEGFDEEEVLTIRF
ncbi:hypothetical protein AALP_AAs58172U000100 [Arabis alpina]|uniref:Uncharacterized protein n=1 Tax=Arabis alpina TaxID=50452 RepID=A0A087FYW7_ARAAL|nr:hypothetical protein AALP_AAs58172U000100 [Arabis alpina]